MEHGNLSLGFQFRISKFSYQVKARHLYQLMFGLLTSKDSRTNHVSKDFLAILYLCIHFITKIESARCGRRQRITLERKNFGSGGMMDRMTDTLMDGQTDVEFEIVF